MRSTDRRAQVGSRDIFSTFWYRKRLKPFKAQIKALKRCNDDLKKQRKNFEIKLDRVSQGKNCRRKPRKRTWRTVSRAMYVNVTLSSITFGAMYLVLSTRLD